MSTIGKISEREIRKKLKNNDKFSFEIKESTVSTNTDAKVLAERGAEQWTVVIAETQTSGKGRMDRKFCSPQGCGIYMSIILRPTFSAEDSLLITTSAAVAVAEAIENLSGKKTGIKWVNDIFIGEKKICGILTEASINSENGLKYAILGIGINVFTPPEDFPEEIRNIAGAIYPSTKTDPDFRNKLISEVLNEFESIYMSLPKKDYIGRYKSRSILTGKEVNILKCGEICGEGTVIDINDEFGLKILHPDNTTEVLSSGEVSVKKKV